jgi:hypothetical protein
MDMGDLDQPIRYSRRTSFAGLSSRRAMNFEWRRWFTSVQSAYSICSTSCGFSQRQSAILSAVRPRPPPALVALGQVRKGAGLDFELVEALENLAPGRNRPGHAQRR